MAQSLTEKIQLQIWLLLWKRYCELRKQRSEIAKLILIPLMFFFLVILLYEVFDTTFIYGDGIEEYFIPIGMWVVAQKMVVQITYEKANKLQEALKMMGLLDFVYYVSYFISDGIIYGIILSFLAAITSTYGLFNDANFGVVLGMMFVYCLSLISFSFFLCSFFDSPQSAGQATLLVMIGFYVIYMATNMSYSDRGSQTLACFFPPLAFQLATGAYKNSYNGVPVSTICGIMFADVFIYAILAWYFSQVWPTSIGIAKPWYFPVTHSYWFPNAALKSMNNNLSPESASPLGVELNGDAEKGVGSMADKHVPMEKVDEAIFGRPSVSVKKLRKTFGSQTAVNGISFDMYENQIFALLGHNGAGKTTTINMLTGLFRPDITKECNVSIYNHDIQFEMDAIRRQMGVCPQHDVLFDNLTVREHILLSAQLKGSSFADADKEATELTTLFHLQKRLDHTGSELSGGQRRKLSVAIAVCGGSKFVVLDEPTAGMDPLARRELWDLLTALRKGRTMLLTTHYMDEADVLGDRVAIMNLGIIQCIGSTQFLKTTYGAGYKLIFDKSRNLNADELHSLTTFVKRYIPDAEYIVDDSNDEHYAYNLPFKSLPQFGAFFEQVEANLGTYHVDNFGITITSLEDVFLKVGEDHSVTPSLPKSGIGSAEGYNATFLSQVIGIAYRKLNYAMHDWITIPLIGLPIAVAIIAASLYSTEVISKSSAINDLVTSALYMGAYLGAPGLIAEFLVRERVNKLRNVLTVMGCDFKAYWVGSLIADYLIMSIPMVVIFITWSPAGMSDFYKSHNGLVFFLLMLFTLQMIAFSYLCTYMFTSPKACMAFMPLFIILLIITPSLTTMLIFLIFSVALKLFTLSGSAQAGIILWGIMILSPHGALFSSLLDTTQDFSAFISSYPPVGATIAFMIVESVIYLFLAYYFDSLSVEAVYAQTDPTFDESTLESLDLDVKEERRRTSQIRTDGSSVPLLISRLRKVFPPKRADGESVVAVEDVSFAVNKGEIFGLLGANGAGKTTTLSMLTRSFLPTSGEAFVSDISMLSDFSRAATHLGVVTQTNSLWDLLSVEDHLYLFARLRGVPERDVKTIVEGTIDQLELTPHRKKLSCRLSGGMKRKLCVAIALIGDPDVVLLDEPSAGLDPVSRRNLWTVILRTMSQRAVVLTTHSMEEAEALCKRIGIMVKGQLRALGTKQHLKVKFSSGYELAVKLRSSTNLAQSLSQVTSFINSIFPRATVIAENGGLITYRVPKEEMKVSKAFSALENNRQNLDIEDYSVSQPTLEQIFIRTVVENTDDNIAKTFAGSAAIIGGSVRMSMEGLKIMDDVSADEMVVDGEVQSEKNKHNNVSYFSPDSDILTCWDCCPQNREVNHCGCTSYYLKVFTVFVVFLFILFEIIAFAARSSLLFVLAIIALIASITGCIILFCPCCRPKKGMDE